MTSVSFNRTFADEKIIQKIAARAARFDKSFKSDDAKLALIMDITAVHVNGNPLRLQDLLNASLGHFSHDIYGITKNIDRTTGKLKNHFRPRYSK